MKNLKITILTLILLVLLAPTLMANQLDISGSLTNDLIIDEDGELENLQKFNLILEQDFGFDGDLHLDLEFDLDQNHQSEFKISEAYLNYYTLNSDWRIGKQTINWGSAYQLQPTDYFNPPNINALKPLDEKLGVTAIQNTYYTAGGMELSGVVVPFFKDSAGLKELEQEIKLLSQSNGEQDGSGIKYPEHELENIQAGVKATKRSFGGYDLSLSAYHGYDYLPVIDLTQGFVGPENEIPAYMEYPEVNKLGFDIIGDLNNIGVWLETAYKHYEDYDNGLEATIGGDYNFSNDLYLVAQAYYNQGRNELEEDIKVLNLYCSMPVFTFHEVELTTLYDLESESYLVEPRFNYSVMDSVELQLGAKLVENKLDGAFGEFLGANQVYTSLQIDF